jgi:two-component system response regulator YesN
MARILIADDEDLERAALKLIISSSGLAPEYVIDEARNGHEALALGTAFPHDAIFLDIRMPGLDGLQTAEALREKGVATPIVIVSAFDAFEYAQKAIRLGVYEYLLKPASSEEVVSALARSLTAGADPGELSRRRDDSYAAIAEASRKLEELVLSQLKTKSLDAEVINKFEKLASLSDSSKTVVVFNLKPSLPSGASDAGGILLKAILQFGVSLCALKCTKVLSAEDGNLGIILAYDYKKTGPEAITPFTGGFLRSLAGDPLQSLVEAMRSKLQSNASFELLCGLAGPGADDMGTLFKRAMEGSRLASPDFPAVRLASLENAEGAALRHIGSREGRRRSLGMRTLDLIQANYSGEVTLGSVAENLGVNPFHLSHAVSKELGIGFSELLTRVRLNRAKELLSGGASVKEACAMVGFSEQAYFTRVFKRHEGMTPKHFIEKTAKKYKK